MYRVLWLSLLIFAPVLPPLDRNCLTFIRQQWKKRRKFLRLSSRAEMCWKCTLERPGGHLTGVMRAMERRYLSLFHCPRGIYRPCMLDAQRTQCDGLFCSTELTIRSINSTTCERLAPSKWRLQSSAWVLLLRLRRVYEGLGKFSVEIDWLCYWQCWRRLIDLSLCNFRLVGSSCWCFQGQRSVQQRQRNTLRLFYFCWINYLDRYMWKEVHSKPSVNEPLR